MSKVWLVTGSGRGLGLEVVRAALAAGDSVVATARDTSTLARLLAEHENALRLFALDVTDADAAQEAADFAVAAFGRIDVLVNNAGYAHLAPFELIAEGDFRNQVDTNFYGVINLVRAVLPVMRRQRAGHVINVSSVGGRVTTPGLSAYQAAKWAVSGFTEILAKETAGFGVRAVSVEPGGIRTDWGSGATEDDNPIPADYDGSVGVAHRRLAEHTGSEVGDPVRIAQVIVDLSRRDDLPAHLILGSDALAAFATSEDLRRREMAAWLPVSQSTDF
ncbi:MAG: SDR family NAD(P)-dependent oxidoreductase [Novosphingobium sp.]|nr:MAG: SDR family NAD(P)-dependent oxidoreductase [Novosphingobium sp.]